MTDVLADVQVHPNALCESRTVGRGTRVWAFAHVLPGAVLGEDCNICDGVFVEGDVVVGDRVTVKCGVQLWDGLRIGNDVFVGPNATFTNDRFPRSRQYQERVPTTVVEDGVSIGANATILPGLRLGRGAMIGAGSVVTRDVPPNSVVVGNPARITGYVGSQGLSRAQTQPAAQRPDVEAVTATEVRGVTLHRLAAATDLRGSLVAGTANDHVPFLPRRFFTVFDVPSKDVRGEHAHRVCEQFLLCLAGSVSVVVDDGTERAEFVLDRPDVAVYMPPLTWGTQYKYSQDAVLLVLASHPYDPEDYIRDYGDFLAEVRVAERQ